MAASLLIEAGAIAARMGNWFTGLACRMPEIVHRALLMVTFSFFDMVTTTPNRGTVLCSREHKAWVAVHSIFIVAPYVVPASQRIRAT